MEIMQMQKSFDLEDVDGSDFECDSEDEEIYDCPEQDDSRQTERVVDGEEEFDDEIYDTPDDAKQELAKMNITQQQQHNGIGMNGQNTNRNYADCNGSLENDKDQMSIADRLSQARAMFNNKENAPERPSVAAKPKPAVARRWPPQKAEEQQDSRSNSLAPCNEKHREVFNKLSRVIGDGNSSKSWERNNNGAANNVSTSNQATLKPDKETSNICPPKIDRSDRPHLEGADNKPEELKALTRNIHNGNNTASNAAALENYDVPSSLMAGTKNAQLRPHNVPPRTGPQTVAPKPGMKNVSPRPGLNNVPPREDRKDVPPKPFQNNVSSRTGPPSASPQNGPPRTGLHNLPPRSLPFEHNIQMPETISTSSPDEEDQYILPVSHPASDEPSFRKPEVSKNGSQGNLWERPDSINEKRSFKNNAPLARGGRNYADIIIDPVPRKYIHGKQTPQPEPQCTADENYEVPEPSAQPVLPERPARTSAPGLQSRQPFEKPAQSQKPLKNPNENGGNDGRSHGRPNFGGGVSRVNTPPQLPPDRPARGNMGRPQNQSLLRRSAEPPCGSSAPEPSMDENYEVPDVNSPPQVPPGRPARGNMGGPQNQPLLRRSAEPPCGSSAPEPAMDENYEVPDVNSPPQVPPGRPARGNMGGPQNQPLLRRSAEPPCGSSAPAPSMDENYEVPDVNSPPQVPPGRPARGNMGGPQNQPLLRRSAEPPCGSSAPEPSMDENYEVLDVNSPPQVPPGRPARGNMGGPQNQPLLRRSAEPPCGSSAPAPSMDENYEVPGASNPPQVPPGRPSKENAGIPPGPGAQGGEPEENYEVPDSTSGPRLPLDRPPRGSLPQGNIPMLGQPGSSRHFAPPKGQSVVPEPDTENYEVPDAVAAKPLENQGKLDQHRNRSIKNLFSSKKKPAPKPPKPSRDEPASKQDFNSGRSQQSDGATQEMYEVMDAESQGGPQNGGLQDLVSAKEAFAQENYEIMDQTTSSSNQTQRCPPEGQENRGLKTRGSRPFSHEDQMLNQVLGGLTNPQQSKPNNFQPSPMKRERPPSLRHVPPRPSDSENPILDLNELQTAVNQPSPSTSPRRPVKMTIEQQPWFFGDVERPRAENMLKNLGRDGTFLIRNTSKVDGYTISIYYQGDIRHLHISRKNDGFHLGTSAKNFDTVEELIAHFKNVAIELKQGGLTKLTITPPKR